MTGGVLALWALLLLGLLSMMAGSLLFDIGELRLALP